MLQSRIANISEFFKGFRIEGGFYLINVVYKNGWSTFNSSDDKIKVTKSENNFNEWFYYANMSDVSLDSMFDLIEETIDFNETIRKKIELLKLKVEELKQIFDEEPLDKLETLEFVFNEPKKKKKCKQNKNESIVTEDFKPEEQELSEVNTEE